MIGKSPVQTSPQLRLGSGLDYSNTFSIFLLLLIDFRATSFFMLLEALNCNDLIKNTNDRHNLSY